MDSDTLPADEAVVARLREGDESMFARLLDLWSPGMLRVARAHVSTRESAEEVVQESWLSVVRGIDSFEGRSSLKTWVFRILANTAKNRGRRESRIVPWPGVLTEPPDEGPTVDPARFRGPDERAPGHWRAHPGLWPSPENELVAAEARDRISKALEELPSRQRLVITLRDVHGYSSAEVCAILEISLANQRVLLHRARAGVRRRLEEYFTGAEEAGL
ncbi:RNA polymerase sigma factor [Rhizohabitans arisaemae]|uniref:RNA polymerase sigma factor n=1 Tax=Rhizohabitans arisaemae TaxID=2720610 RepID=UPI0024B13C9F|nr:sigma-70 family RNA polymerase sigma factor [Rhizohabitans arisaemae]